MPKEREERFLKYLESKSDFIKDRVCVSFEIWDQSVQYWVTCEKSWLKKNYPELLEDIGPKEPEHLDWEIKYYGYNFTSGEL